MGLGLSYFPKMGETDIGTNLMVATRCGAPNLHAVKKIPAVPPQITSFDNIILGATRGKVLEMRSRDHQGGGGALNTPVHNPKCFSLVLLSMSQGLFIR